MIRVVIGKKGSGKTTLTKNLLNKTLRNFVILDVSAEYLNFGIITTDHSQFNNAINLKFFKIVYITNYSDLEKIGLTILNTKNMIVIFDESFEVFKFPIISKMIRFSRRANITLIFVSHRIYDIPPILRSQMDTLDIFKMQEIRDLDYLKNFIPKLNIQQVVDLDKFEFIEYDINSDILTSKILKKDFSEKA